MNKRILKNLKPDHALLALLALASAGCAVGPDFKRPAAPESAGYTRAPLASTLAAPVPGGDAQHFSVGAAVQQQWWQAFGSSALNDLVKRALAQNPTISSAQAALRAAHENTAAQFGSYFPVLQADYSPSRQRNAVGTISPTLSSGDPLYTLHTAQLSVSYAPDVFGLNRRTVESLQAQEDMQRDQLQAAYLTLASNVASAAIQEAALRAQIRATQDVIDADRKALDILQSQARLGFASGLDVAAQESALAQAQQALPPLSKQLEQTRDLLAVLAGQLPAQGGTDDFDLDSLRLPQELPVSLPATLVRQRPDVRAAEDAVHAASAEVGIAVANRLPQLSLSAAYGGSATQFSQMFADDNKFWSLTGNVSQTLFDFGSLRHHQHAAEAALDQAKAQYRGTVLTAFQNVADALYALDADAQALVAAASAETAAKRTLDLTQRQFDLGAINGLSLLSARTSWQQAVLARVQAQAARYTDTVALFQALGGAWQQPDGQG